MASQKLCFNALVGGSLSDVSIITGDCPALGHGVFVDPKACDQAMGLLLGKSLPAYLTHDGAFEDRLTQEIGYFSGFYRAGQQIKAKAFSFFDSFKKEFPMVCEKLTELATKVPEHFGLSVVFSGYAVYCMPDGSEIQAGSDIAPADCLYGMPCIRFSAIESCDFVKSPAANPGGLFSIPVDGAQKAMSANTEPDKPETFTFEQHNAALSALKTEHKAALDALSAALAAKDEEHKTAMTAALAAAEADKLAAIEAAKTEGVAALGVEPISRKPKQDEDETLPTPAQSDFERWQQYSELEKRSKKLAAKFYEQHLKRAR
jgi:hypothetical protein